MKTFLTRSRCRAACAMGAAGMLLQFGSCNISQIPVTSTVDGRQLMVDLLRGAILTPIDDAVTAWVNSAFDRWVDE